MWVTGTFSRSRKYAFLVAYIILWIASDIAGRYYAGRGGFGAWYINAALDVILFLVLGWAWWPLPVLLAVASVELAPTPQLGTFDVNIVGSILYELIYAVTTKVTIESLGVRFPLRSVRDVTIFATTLCAVAPLLSNAAILAALRVSEPSNLTWSQFMNELVKGAAADITAIIVLVPAITQFFEWRTPLISEGSDRGIRIGRTFAFGLVATCAIVVAEYIFGIRLGRPLVEFSFLPLAWMAIAFGMRGALLGTLVADITATLMHVALHVQVTSQVEYECYLVACALMAMLLGAVTTDRQRLLGRLERAANFDGLTNLPNISGLQAWIRGSHERVVLALIDIVDLRALIEGVGRDAVDRVLFQCSKRLRGGLPPEYFIARVGGGEFAVAIAADVSIGDVLAKVEGLFVDPFDIANSSVFVEASIGAVRSEGAIDVAELLRRADLAVRRAKNTPTRAAVYEAAVDEHTAPLLVVELHRAADRHEFAPFFQPIYRHANGQWELAGAEMLMRWRHPQRGLLAPADFIDLLERLSICNRVGWELLGESLELAMRWRVVVPNFRVWVNFFPRQVFDSRCLERVRIATENAHAVPDALVVEITERVVTSSDREIAHLARDLRSLGVATAIDDFGAGGSSLGRIREVPVGFLKIDKSFVNRCEVDPAALAVASAVVRLASELNMSALAEGIENSRQVNAILGIGCEYGQGYALGHPVPAELFEPTLTKPIAI